VQAETLAAVFAAARDEEPELLQRGIVRLFKPHRRGGGAKIDDVGDGGGGGIALPAAGTKLPIELVACCISKRPRCAAAIPAPAVG